MLSNRGHPGDVLAFCKWAFIRVQSDRQRGQAIRPRRISLALNSKRKMRAMLDLQTEQARNGAR